MRRMILLSLACMMALLCACASPDPSESPENSEMWTHEENSITQTSPPPQTDSEPTPSEQLPPEEIHEETVQEKDAPVSSIPTGENGDKNQSEPPADTSSKPSKPLATDPTEPVSQPQTSQPAIPRPPTHLPRLLLQNRNLPLSLTRNQLLMLITGYLSLYPMARASGSPMIPQPQIAGIIPSSPVRSPSIWSGTSNQDWIYTQQTA